jgi:glycosyltransferase involved in cell wall biosynthesis
MAGLTDYIRHKENGYLVKPGDPKEISDAVIDYSKLSLKEKGQMKHSALEMAKKYESKFVAIQLGNKLKELTQ